MDRRRLMHPAGDRFEIMNAECKRVTTTVPADHVKRMMPVMDPVDHPLFLRPDQKIPLIIMGGQRLRPPNIPFAIRRMLQQLSVWTKIFFGIPDRAERFDNKQPVVPVIEPDS